MSGVDLHHRVGRFLWRLVRTDGRVGETSIDFGEVDTGVPPGSHTAPTVRATGCWSRWPPTAATGWPRPARPNGYGTGTARYYAELAVQAEPRLYGHDQRRWLRRLDSETANLRSALDHAVRQRDAERALRLVCACTWYWFLRGRLAEARRSLRTALAVNVKGEFAALRARAAA
jgi:hypothetical protein